MRLRTILAALPLLSLTAGCRGCANEHALPASIPDGATVLEPVLGADPDDAPRAAFHITSVHRNTKPSDAAPWWTPGGDWVFFDATLDGSPPVPFTVGVRSPPPKQQLDVGFGDAVIATPTPNDGARFVERIASAFHTKPPPPRHPAPIRPEVFHTAVLGVNVARASNGMAGSGTWTATKWFFEEDGLEAEVFFNYDETLKVGEFTEKDGSYRDDLVASFAVKLRDGKAPERTPANDPRLVDDGPRPGTFRAIGGSNARWVGFVRGRAAYADIASDGKHTVSIVAADGTPVRELTSVANDVRTVACVDNALTTCVLQEVARKGDGSISSDDPTRAHLIRAGKSDSKRDLELRGPWGDHAELADAPISPGGRYVVFLSWEKRDAGPGRDRVIHVHDVDKGTTTTAHRSGTGLQVIGWTRVDGALHAIVRDGYDFDRPEERHAYALDPSTGALSDPTPVPTELAPETSPDLRHRFEIRQAGGEIAIVDTASNAARVFNVHPDDVRFIRAGSVRWVGSRYLHVHTTRDALIDTERLKMSYPWPKPDTSPDAWSYEISPDMSCVVRMQKGRLEIAPFPATGKGRR